MVRWLRWHFLQTQDSKFDPWRSEAEHATSRSRRLPTILTFTRGWGIFVSFKPPRPGTEPRTLAWKAAVLTTTLGPPPTLCVETPVYVQYLRGGTISVCDLSFYIWPFLDQQTFRYVCNRHWLMYQHPRWRNARYGIAASGEWWRTAFFILALRTGQANIMISLNAVLILVHRLQRWPNIKPSLVKRVVRGLMEVRCGLAISGEWWRTTHFTLALWSWSSKHFTYSGSQSHTTRRGRASFSLWYAPVASVCDLLLFLD